MGSLLRIARSIDRTNDAIGRGVAWLTLAMLLLGAYNALARYLGRSIGLSLSSNAYIELQWYMFSLVFLLAAAATLRRNAHVRVDVIYGRLRPKTRAWINLLGTTFLLLPFTAATLWLSIPSVRNSWAVREVSPDPGGLARYPIKAAILVSFLLLIAQGISEAIKQTAVLRGAVIEEDESAAATPEGV